MQKINRGVVVDDAGYFIAALQWEDKNLRPQLNAKNGPKLHLLETDEALAVESEKGRWNFKQKKWEYPTETFHIINKKTGDYVASKKIWRERLPLLPPTQEWVEEAPPKIQHAKPIWTGSEWKEPRKVALIDANGVVENVVLENPREDTENVPYDGERVDDRDWPLDINGQPIWIGHKKVETKWIPPKGETV